MSSSTFSWCTKCGYQLAAGDLPPVGAHVSVVLVYTNATNPRFPVAVVRIGVALKRFDERNFVSMSDGTVVPASAIVAWRRWTAPDRARRIVQLEPQEAV